MDAANVLCIYFHTLTIQTNTPTQYFWECTTLVISEDIDSPEVFN